MDAEVGVPVLYYRPNLSLKDIASVFRLVFNCTHNRK